MCCKHSNFFEFIAIYEWDGQKYNFQKVSLNWPPDGVRWCSSRNLLELAISRTDGISVHISIVTTKTADFSKKQLGLGYVKKFQKFFIMF